MVDRRSPNHRPVCDRHYKTPMSRAPGRRGARKRLPIKEFTPRSRRLFKFCLLFIGSVFVVNALVGERGLIDSIEARRQQQRLTREIDQLHHQNEHLRREARRLREDPGAIEEVARRDLGLIKSGELLFLLLDGPRRAPEDRASAALLPTSPTGRPIGFVDRVENRMLACEIVVDGAGWSSPVARWAHNPKVGGSNPPPATNVTWCRRSSESDFGPAAANIAAKSPFNAIPASHLEA